MQNTVSSASSKGIEVKRYQEGDIIRVRVGSLGNVEGRVLLDNGNSILLTDAVYRLCVGVVKKQFVMIKRDFYLTRRIELVGH